MTQQEKKILIELIALVQCLADRCGNASAIRDKCDSLAAELVALDEQKLSGKCPKCGGDTCGVLCSPIIT